MAYKKIALYFTWIDEYYIKYYKLIYTLWLDFVPLNIFGQAIKGANLTKFKSLQLLILKESLFKKISVYKWRKISTNELV